jgi:transcriptional regulator with XRE-family HTH domain
MSVEKSINVGSRIRELREQCQLSLRALADISEVSPNTISLIERDLSSPCVDTLQRLATGLGVPIKAFFETGEPPAELVLVKAMDRIESRCPGMTIEHLASDLADHACASFLVTLEPGAGTTTKPIDHSGVEWVYCLDGAIEYQVKGKEYQLAPGDNLLFDASLPHRWWNPGPEHAQMILILDAGERQDLSVEQHLQI